ncbi:C1QL [Mytilus edulis]|uniref:C1QL n=1 Tax=Mytilus edulis TaxID=6550 RepID=A0A8S3QQF0_MYTED|nr:C1QL [Mytilus edulis]
MYVEGFLLNPGQTSSPGMITSQCISMDMYLAEKKELRNQIFQFQRENEQTLQLLTTQLQQKLTVIDDKLKQSNKPNDTIELAHLEQKNRDLELNLTILQEKHRLLQISYVRQNDQLDLLKNKSTEVIKELSEIKQLKSVNQTLDLRVVQSYNEMLKKGETIAFSAYREETQSLSAGTKVLFNKVWTNVGNGYQASTGIFTAPREGLYHFTAVLMSTSGGSFFRDFITIRRGQHQG